MNWEAIGAIAEIVGAVGVLRSLVYLGYQIRQNTNWLRQQAFQLSTNEVRRWASTFAHSKTNSEIFLRGQTDFGSLDPAERFQFTMMVFELCSVWATYQSYSGEDLLGLRESANTTIGAWIEQGWFVKWWSYNSYMFPPTFQEFIVRLIEEKSSGA